MSEAKLIMKAIEELAAAILDKEYGKDLSNEPLMRMLSDGAWINFALATRLDNNTLPSQEDGAPGGN